MARMPPMANKKAEVKVDIKDAKKSAPAKLKAMKKGGGKK